MSFSRRQAATVPLGPAVGGLVVAIGLSLAASVVWADGDEPSWSGQLRWGLEYDDNPHRIEDPDGGDLLTRYLVGGDIVTDIGASGQVDASLRHGGTRFARDAEANAVLTGVDMTGTWRPTDSVYVQALADVKDRTEQRRRRDYTRGGAFVRLGASLEEWRTWVDAGGRFFAFKPTPRSSHRGPQLRAGLRWAPRADLAVDTSVQRGWRNFESRAWQLEDDRFAPLHDTPRADIYDRISASVAYRRDVSARLGLQYINNRSNSYGQAMDRYGLQVALTVPTVWDIFASVRGELQRTRYEDPVALDEFFLVDEEHRNTVVVAASRTVVEPWEMELRYSRYSQEFGIDGDYRRQTLAVAVGLNLEGDD